MTPRVLRHVGTHTAARESLFNLLEDPRAADRLNPPFVTAVVTEAPWMPRVGAHTVIELTYRGSRYDLTLELAEYRRGHFLLERQVAGPFASFERAVSLEDAEDDGTRVTEVVVYSVGFGFLGRLFDRVALARDLATVLAVRQQHLAELFALEP